GRDQRLLEPLPRLVVRRVEGGNGELTRERSTALRQGVAEPPEEPALLLCGVRLGLGVAEQLGPRSRHRTNVSQATAVRRSAGMPRETICDTPSPLIVTP